MMFGTTGTNRPSTMPVVQVRPENVVSVGATGPLFDPNGTWRAELVFRLNNCIASHYVVLPPSRIALTAQILAPRQAPHFPETPAPLRKVLAKPVS